MLEAALCTLFLLQSSADFEETERHGISLKSDVDDADRDALFDLAAAPRVAAVELLDRLEIHRHAERRLRLRIFADEAGFEDYRRRTRDSFTNVDTLSFYNDRDHEVVCAWRNGIDEAKAQVRRQCARHVLLDHGQNPPLWFLEGFAAYFEGWHSDPFGDPMHFQNEARLSVIRQALEREVTCPLFELMDMQAVQYYGLWGAESSKWSRSTLYAQSWSLFDYLLHAPDPDDQEVLRKVAERVDTGRWDQGWFEQRLAALEPRWREFVADDAAQRRVADLVSAAWDSLYDDDPHRGLGFAAAALELAPDLLSARRAYARALFGTGEFAAAGDAFEDYSTRRPGDYDALLSAAVCRLRLVEETGGRDDAERAIASARRAAGSAARDDRARALSVGADAADAISDTKLALRLVREALKVKGISGDLRVTLRQREASLVKVATTR